MPNDKTHSTELELKINIKKSIPYEALIFLGLSTILIYLGQLKHGSVISPQNLFLNAEQKEN